MNTLNKRILIALLDFAQCDVRASVAHLAFELHQPRRAVADGLNELAVLGLVNPETCRLTMVGLALASGLRAESVAAEMQTQKTYAA